jgi:hypothetical protein
MVDDEIVPVDFINLIKNNIIEYRKERYIIDTKISNDEIAGNISEIYRSIIKCKNMKKKNKYINMSIILDFRDNLIKLLDLEKNNYYCNLSEILKNDDIKKRLNELLNDDKYILITPKLKKYKYNKILFTNLLAFCRFITLKFIHNNIEYLKIYKIDSRFNI